MIVWTICSSSPSALFSSFVQIGNLLLQAVEAVFPAQGHQEISTRDMLTERQTQGTQALVERCDGVIADRTNAAFAQVGHGEGLQDVVQLAGRESMARS